MFTSRSDRTSSHLSSSVAPTGKVPLQVVHPAEFGGQFGVDEAEIAQVQQWLQSQGLAVHEVSQRSEPVLISSLLRVPETRASAEPPVS